MGSFSQEATSIPSLIESIPFHTLFPVPGMLFFLRSTQVSVPGSQSTGMWPCSVIPFLTPPQPGKAPSSVLPSSPGATIMVCMLVDIYMPPSVSPLLDSELSPQREATVSQFISSIGHRAQYMLIKHLLDEWVHKCFTVPGTAPHCSTPLWTFPSSHYRNHMSFLGTLKKFKKDYFMVITFIFPPDNEF